jgi:hypothetical protein
MNHGRETNHHFRELIKGAPPQVTSEIGEALLALEAERRGEKADACTKLRSVWLMLARYLVRDLALDLNPEQQLFLLSGALADHVVVKNAAGERITVELVPEDWYSSLLDSLDATVPEYIISPLRRMTAMAGGEITPLDLDKPVRYREPGKHKAKQGDQEDSARLLHSALLKLDQSQQLQGVALKAFLKCISVEKLSPVLEALKELSDLAQRALKVRGGADQLSKLAVPAIQGAPVLRQSKILNSDISRTLGELEKSSRQVLEALHSVRAIADACQATGLTDVPAVASESVSVDDAAAKAVERDISTVHGVVIQQLANNPLRSAWSACRVLLTEQVEKVDDPLTESFATPDNLDASIVKITNLHPNCFPQDSHGVPVLPPIIIEPGVGIAQWYDDRFIISFVCNDAPRRGKKLNLSPVDLAVLSIFGQFLARGELFTFRGERATGNFIADYAGEVEQKAKAKFAGKDKKLTYTTATEVKDTASRDDAVRDYIDFIFHVFNGLTVPRRITPRRISVFLQYCIIGNEEMSAILALKHVLPYDPLVAREIVIKLAKRDDGRIVELVRTAVENDPQIASRYHNDLLRVVKELMGRDFATTAERNGLLASGPIARRPAQFEGPGATETETSADHDYFGN